MSTDSRHGFLQLNICQNATFSALPVLGLFFFNSAIFASHAAGLSTFLPQNKDLLEALLIHMLMVSVPGKMWVKPLKIWKTSQMNIVGSSAFVHVVKASKQEMNSSLFAESV